MSAVDLLRLTTMGSVDDGKSTLLGRLLYETNAVFTDHLAEARRSTVSASVREAGEEIDLSLLTDGLKAEREQGITIDVAYRYFSTPRRKFILADTPGHEQYTRNMATGASTADAAVLVVDAHGGVRTQTRRHLFIASLLGIRHCVVCVNKMDRVGWDQARFDELSGELRAFAARLDIPDLRFVPISALRGDNVVTRSARTPWYEGPPLLDLLETVYVGSDRNLIDLRFPVQLALRPDQSFRGYAGQVASGIVRPGDEVVVLPSRRRTRVTRIVSFDGDLRQAFAPQAVTLCLADEVDVGRGDMLVHPHNQPLVAHRLEAMVVWMQDEPLRVGAEYLLKHTTRTVRARVERLQYEVDVDTLGRRETTTLGLNVVGRVALSTHRPLFFDAYRKNRSTGCLILIDPLTHATAGAGMIIDREPVAALPSSPREEMTAGEETPSRVGLDERARRLGQRPATLWLSGLPASGAAEVGRALERLLFDRGAVAVVLDGPALRTSLSRDLDHSAGDTWEHVRRVAFVARTINDAGLIAVCCVGSPTRDLRAAARDAIGPERFLEVHVASPLAWCEARDPRGLYAAARDGAVTGVPGVSAPYEPPAAPAAVVRPDVDGFEGAAAALLRLIEARELLVRDEKPGA